MPKFHFAGDALLKLRQGRLDRIGAQLAAADSRRAAGQRQRIKLEEALKETLEIVPTEQRLNGAHLRNVEAYRSHLTGEIAKRLARSETDLHAVTKLRAQLAQARQQTRLLERLRERRLRAHQYAEELRDENERDDQVIQRWQPAPTLES